MLANSMLFHDPSLKNITSPTTADLAFSIGVGQCIKETCVLDCMILLREAMRREILNNENYQFVKSSFCHGKKPGSNSMTQMVEGFDGYLTTGKVTTSINTFSPLKNLKTTDCVSSSIIMMVTQNLLNSGITSMKSNMLKDEGSVVDSGMDVCSLTDQSTAVEITPLTGSSRRLQVEVQLILHKLASLPSYVIMPGRVKQAMRQMDNLWKAGLMVELGKESQERLILGTGLKFIEKIRSDSSVPSLYDSLLNQLRLELSLLDGPLSNDVGIPRICTSDFDLSGCY
jgi:hypothetical protein